jgi:protein SCO1/2
VIRADSRTRRRHAAAALAALALSVGGCRPELAGRTIEPHRPAPDVGALRMTEQRGRVVLLTFGFVSCPVVCPLTLSRMASAYERLGDDARRVTMAFATVDPERDTPERLREHVARFDRRITPLHVDRPALADSLAGYGATATPRGEGAATAVEHTAGVFVSDTQGRLRLFHRHDVAAELLVADVRRLLAEAER